MVSVGIRRNPIYDSWSESRAIDDRDIYFSLPAGVVTRRLIGTRPPCESIT